ncbi:hypothetical protein GLOIN_2v1761221 [Rhizophagus clarus]|uniref:Crinkler effector protein N-terminal domain-containing protein n=2 Tax=Rhizophagus clarus TaxID=94130 RepID=A0A8H3L0R7_9GLOM|nr:hypothetical protein GLOIN_2v1761221 [Rhizophagus clarus]
MSEKSDGLIKYELLNTHHEKRSFRSFFEMSLFSLFCVVLSNPLRDPFPIDISEINVINDHHPRISIEHLSVGHLKSLINNKKLLVSDSDNLTLWNIEGLAEGNDKWGILEQIVTKELNNKTSTKQKLKKLRAKVLNSSRLVKNIFSVVLKEHVHIIVKTSPLTTTGKRRMVEDEEDNRAKKQWQKDKNRFQNLINNLPEINVQDKYLRNFILNDTKFSRYLITGNPGIGKTFFGRLMPIVLLKENKKVLLDYEAVTALIYPSGDTEYVSDKVQYRQIAEEQDVWCIIDGKRDQLGHDFSNGKLIMVSLPKKSIIGDFAKQWCVKLYMPIWNKFEVEDCWKNVYCEKVPSESLESLKDKFKLCGGIPRLIFGESLLYIKSAIKQELISVGPGMLCNQSKDFSGDEYTHKLIHMRTNLEEIEVEGEKADPYTGCFCFFGSDYIAYKCLKRLKEKYKEDLRTFIETARDIPEMGSLRGQLFELVSHEILCQGGTFPVRKLTDDGSLGPETTLTLESLEEMFFDDISEIEGNTSQGQNKYYRPTSKIFESIDSYVRYNKLFQVTVAKSHGIKQEGLRAIKGILKDSCRISFYFVLPKNIFETYTKKQKYKNKGEGIRIDGWIKGDIDKYALCIDFNKCSF